MLPTSKFKTRFTISILFYSIGLIISSQQSTYAQVNSKPVYQEGKLYLKFKNAQEALITSYLFAKEYNQKLPSNSSLLKQISEYKISNLQQAFKLKAMEQFTLVEFEEINRSEELLKILNTHPLIEYAEQVPLHYTSLTPNDLNSDQWSLNKIQAEEAWDISTGSSSIVVAVVDDAVYRNHNDLKNNIWTNPNEIPGNNQDDDGNGYVDDVQGYDISDGDNNPNPPSSANADFFSHGTHCAGIISAQTNNGSGIASIGYNVQIMPVKTAPNSSSGETLPHSIQGVVYALNSGADIVSMSWGSYGFSYTEQALFQEAFDAGIHCIAAAGNDNVSDALYPASYPSVISVAASTSTDKKASFSNYGSTIDVSAPGTQILSTVAGGSNSEYAFYSGTSMACPLVAGTAALMLSHQPGTSPAELKDCLKSTADNTDAQNPSFVNQIGDGRINAFKALDCLSEEITVNATLSPHNEICSGESIQFTDTSSPQPTSWNWQFPGGNPSSSTAQNPAITYPNSGNYSFTLTVNTAEGSKTKTFTNTIKVIENSASISGSTFISPGQSANLQIDFEGTAPWSINYSNGSDTLQIDNITSNPFTFAVNPNQSTIYSLVNANSINCSASTSGLATVIVLAGASEGPCASTPKVEAGINQQVCLGETISLQATNASSYQWSSLPNSINPDQAEISFIPNTSKWYSVTGTNENGCTSSDSLFITVLALPYFPASNLDTTICESAEAFQLNKNIQAVSNYSYKWSPETDLDNPNSPNPICQPTASRNYTLKITNAQGCSTYQEVNINIQENDLNPYLAKQNLSRNGVSIDLHPGTFDQYLWSDNSTDPYLSISEAGHYSVTVSDGICEASSSVQITSQAPPPFIFPTAFSPNNDGLNDYFQPKVSEAVESIEWRVYNRWGKTIFSTNSRQAKWNGHDTNSPAPHGLYVFEGEIALNNGTKKIVKGQLTLIR